MIENKKISDQQVNIVTDIRSCSTIIRPDIPPLLLNPPDKNYVLETANGEMIPVIVISHKFFIADWLDAVLFGIEIMLIYWFKLKLEERILKITDDEIMMTSFREKTSGTWF